MNNFEFTPKEVDFAAGNFRKVLFVYRTLSFSKQSTIRYTHDLDCFKILKFHTLKHVSVFDERKFH